MELMSNMAIFDTMIVVWKEKRRWDAVRPFSAIRYLYGDQVRNQTLTTLHLKIKKLSMNSPRDSNSVLHNINYCWIDSAKYFCLKSSSLSAINDSLEQYCKQLTIWKQCEVESFTHMNIHFLRKAKFKTSLSFDFRSYDWLSNYKIDFPQAQLLRA